MRTMTHECTTYPCTLCGSGIDDSPANWDQESLNRRIEIGDTVRCKIASVPATWVEGRVIYQEPEGGRRFYVDWQDGDCSSIEQVTWNESLDCWEF
jgi:hypothetical protein